MDPESTAAAPAGLTRRLLALLYDLLLASALAVAATFAVLPLTGGEAILVANYGPVAHLYHAFWLLAVFGYFGLGWTRGGQTLGMKAWRIRLATARGDAIRWPQAALRFATGAILAALTLAGAWLFATAAGWDERVAAIALLLPAVLNLAWIPFDRLARSLQDLAERVRVTKTR